MAREEQTSDLADRKGTPIMGSGTDKKLNEATANRLVETSGGEAGDWVKVRSSNKTHHGYENNQKYFDAQ